MKTSTVRNIYQLASRPYARKQQGAVLLIALVLLMVLTILGVSAMHNTVMEEKMVGNMRDKGLSFQAAEATLRYAEKLINDTVVSTNAFDTNGKVGYYDKTNLELWQTLNWDTSDSIANADFGTAYHVAEPPRFIIQHIASIATNQNSLNLGNYGQNTGAGTNEIFLITARATGGSGDAPVILQTTFGKII